MPLKKLDDRKTQPKEANNVNEDNQNQNKISPVENKNDLKIHSEKIIYPLKRMSRGIKFNRDSSSMRDLRRQEFKNRNRGKAHKMNTKSKMIKLSKGVADSTKKL